MRSSGGEDANPLQQSCLENPTKRGAWRATVHRVAESDMTEVTWHTRAIHSSVLAWGIPWTEEPGELQSMESQRVGHDRVTTTTATYQHWVPPTMLNAEYT